MIVRNPDQRVAVLVDSQNMYYSARNLFNTKVNFKALLKHVVHDRLLVRAIAYVINAEAAGEKINFFEALNEAGFEVKEKELTIFLGGAKKGDWDLGIAMDAIRLGNKVDSIVLITGDGDFCPVVNYLQQSLGCLVEVVAFRHTSNHQLIEMADDFTDIEEHKTELLFRSRPEGKKHPSPAAPRKAAPNRKTMNPAPRTQQIPPTPMNRPTPPIPSAPSAPKPPTMPPRPYIA
jgi:uncharacterized LabA/DUF88 family protein